MSLNYAITRDRVSTRDLRSLPGKEEIRRLLASTARPFVAINDRELSVLRRGLTKDGWKRVLYRQEIPSNPAFVSGAGLLALANRWLSAEIRIPDQGGCFHDFFCDDGAPLELPDIWDNSEPHYRCPACGSIYEGEKYDAAVRWFYHQALAYGCLTLALVCQIDRNTDCGDKAVEILRKYAHAYPGAHTGAAAGGMLQKSIDEARWLIPLAQAYDLVYYSKAISHDDRNAIENDLLRKSASALLDIEADGDWVAWHTAAAGLIGCANKDGDLLISAIDKFDNLIRYELSSDGLWPEYIHTHHFSPLSAFVLLAESCNRIGVNLYNYEPMPGKSLKSMFLSPLAYAYPSFQLPAINDGWFHSALPLSLYEVAYRRWGDPSFAWVLKTGYGFSCSPSCDLHIDYRSHFSRSSLYAFLFGRDLPGRVQAPKLMSTIFDDSGICVLRNDTDTVVTLDYGRFSRNGQLGKMGITLYTNGKMLCADYGTPGRGSAIFDYYTGTSSHNTVMVDGKDQARTSESSLLAFRPGEYLQMAEAETAEAYPGVKHVRRIITAGDVIMLQDWLSSDSEHTYDWLLHCEGELCDSVTGDKPAGDIPKCFSDACESGRGVSHTVSWSEKNYGLNGWFVMDAPGELITAHCPAETAARTIPAVILRRNGKSSGYLAILAPYCDERPKIKNSGKAIQIVRGNITDWLYSADSLCGELSKPGGQFETDAEIATVREVGGKVVNCGLYNGSYVKLNDEYLVQGSGTFEQLEIRLDTRMPTITFEGASGGYIRLRCLSRAMRVNGHRISAAGMGGMATIRLVGVLAGL